MLFCMKNKNLILIILFVALIIIILIIVHICSFLPAASVSDRKEFVTDKIDHTNHDSKKDVPHDEHNKPTPTPQDNIKTASPTPQEEKQPVKEELFEFLMEYNDHTYYISKNKAKWMEAAAFCEENGGYLVTITSIEENKALIAALKEKKIRQDMWIGLSDHDQEGKWKWVTGEELSFTYWDATQPDNWAKTEMRVENFALIWFSQYTKLPYHWNDACDMVKARFILEREPK
jgi:hypothetical protein